MKKLAVYLRPYWKAAVLAPLLMLMEVAMDLLQPTLMANIIDQGVAAGDIRHIVRVGGIMIVVALLGVVGGMGCTVFSSIASQSFGADLRLDVFKKIQSFSFTNLDKFKTASLITRLTNDIVQIQNIVLMMLRVLVRSPLLFLGGLIMAVTINPGLSLILVGTVPVLVVLLNIVIRKGFPLFSTVQKKLDRVNDVMRENLAGVRVVKAFVRSDYENGRFGKANHSLTETTIKASRIVGLTMPVMTLVMNLSIVAVIWFGGIRVNSGNMQLGQVIAFINYMTQILFSLTMVAFLLMNVSRAKASSDRVIEVLETGSEPGQAPGASHPAPWQGRIDFDHVAFQYEGAGGEPVLRDITFSALPGETVAILGSTGSGKSTLVSLIPRFYDVTQGRILIDGTDVRQINLASLRESISVVLQESILFSGTIRDNIRWGRENASEAEVVEAAKAAQAHDFIQHFPDGYDTVLGQRGVNLSGGQKQRLSIARALLKKPAVLILDDSTSAVDMATEARLQEALRRTLKASTRIIIAQRISSVMDADKIIVLEEGAVADMGTHDQLIRSSAVYQDIYHSQIGEEAV